MTVQTKAVTELKVWIEKTDVKYGTRPYCVKVIGVAPVKNGLIKAYFEAAAAVAKHPGSIVQVVR